MFIYALADFSFTNVIDFTRLTLIRLIAAIVGLVFIEQLFRNTRPENRWAVKFLFFGIGGIFAYDFYLYADALLFNRVDIDVWNARGFVNALTVPFIIVSIVRNKDWSADLFVSREIVFHSVAVTGIGLYLLLMATGGYYIRIYGGDWGGVAQIAFLFGAGIILFVLMFSGQMRARLRVFIVKNFHHYKYDHREEWLRVIRLLSTKQKKQELRGNAIRLLADVVESPGVGLWIRNEVGEYRAVASWNMDDFDEYSAKDNTSMVKFLKEWQWVVNLNEYTETPELYQDLELPDWVEGEQKFWLIVPLMLQTQLYGFVILGHARATMKVGWEERDLLLTIGRQISSYFALIDVDETLAESRQFEAYNRLSAYVVHDLKNLVAQLSLVVSNAGKHKGNPEFMEDAIETVENAVNKMSKLLSQLRKGTVEKINLKAVNIGELLQEIGLVLFWNI
jgi:putative PEP-CTERM system histidine kinase